MATELPSMIDPLAYYRQHSAMSDPGVRRALFDLLPNDLPGLHSIAQNVLIHVWKIRKFHPDFLEGRTEEIELRTVSGMLAQMMQYNDQSLTVKRPREQRLIVDCRHFAAFLCAMLRHQGIPARTRTGFATYLEQSHYQDHWVCEYWNGERWILEDPDLLMHNISRDQFIVAGQAWQMCRTGNVDANKFGYANDPGMLGMWTIRNNLVRDLAALNKIEEMSMAGWGLVRGPEAVTDPAVLAVLDRAAEATLCDNNGFSTLIKFYQNTPEVRAPAVVEIYNYVTDRKHRVAIDVS
jgi:hypothetical protein